MNKLERLKLTKKIELTAEEDETLRAALYYAICHSKEVLERFDDNHDFILYKEHLKLLEGYESLYNRLYGYIPDTTEGGAADEK